jgi:hypothetical protein
MTISNAATLERPRTTSERRSVDRSEIDTVLARIQAEYQEMPGLTLTSPQAKRLWNLSAVDCDRLLSRLVKTGFLRIDAAGSYRRR